MKNILLIFALAFTGCANFKTIQTDESFNPITGEKRKITTEASANTFAASKTALANWKASQTDKTQGASVGSLTQESNVENLVEAAARGGAQGMTGKK